LTHKANCSKIQGKITQDNNSKLVTAITEYDKTFLIAHKFLFINSNGIWVLNTVAVWWEWCSL